MVPRGTIPQRAAANCRLTRPISTMADVVIPSKLPTEQPIVSSVRLEPLAAAAQSKDWQKRRLPPPPLRVSCASGARTTQGLAAAWTHVAI